MTSKFSLSKYAGVTAMAVWTLGWVAAAVAAFLRVGKSGDGTGFVGLVITTLFAGLGHVMLIRAARRNKPPEPENNPPQQTHLQRLESRLAAVVWCGGGVLWNAASISFLIRAASSGQWASLLIILPFSFIGLFLLVVTFTGIATLFDSILNFGASSSPVLEPSLRPPLSEAAPCLERAGEESFKKPHILAALVLISFLNWFVFFGIDMWLGGNALGTFPSRDGFVVSSHGHHKEVSEAVWKLSLYYSGATLLLTPLIWLTAAARKLGRHLKETGGLKRVMTYGFILVWVVTWYLSIGNSMRRSIEDWHQYRQSSASVQFVPDESF